MTVDGRAIDRRSRSHRFLTSDKPTAKWCTSRDNGAVEIAGNKQVGTEEEPVVVVFDTPDGSPNAWDFKGTGDFYGIMVTVGDNELRGTVAMHGAVYCKGTIGNKGNGSRRRDPLQPGCHQQHQRPVRHRRQHRAEHLGGVHGSQGLLIGLKKYVSRADTWTGNT